MFEPSEIVFVSTLDLVKFVLHLKVKLFKIIEYTH